MLIGQFQTTEGCLAESKTTYSTLTCPYHVSATAVLRMRLNKVVIECMSMVLHLFTTKQLHK